MEGFFIWTPHGASVQRLEHNENLWKQMYSQLKAFYHESFPQNLLIQFSQWPADSTPLILYVVTVSF